MQKALITTAQIRAARALLRWSAFDLSNASGIGISTIKRFEVMDGVPAINISTMVAIQKALESAGVEFIGSPDDRPGVRLKK
jgi:DNA-binding Xre family transcriptional regulator